MIAFVSLLNREFLEHRVAFLYLPVGIATGLVVLALLSFTGTVRVGDEAELRTDDDRGTSFVIEEPTPVRRALEHVAAAPPSERPEIVHRALYAAAAPAFAVLWVVLFFYLLSALHTERADRSVLFFKSLPVSDATTVASKVAAACVLAPAVALAGVAVTHLVLGIIATPVAWIADLSAWELVWAPSQLPLLWLNLIGVLLVQALWSLPWYGWLLLVSVSSGRVPFLVALLTPAAFAFVEKVLFDTSVFIKWLLAHVLWIAMPGPAGLGSRIEQTTGHPLGYGLLGTLDMWFGVAVGLALLAGAVWFRRRNNEL